jgi:hypothetical protein
VVEYNHRGGFRQVIYCAFVDPHQTAQRSADQVQLILNDQVGGPEQRMRLSCDRWILWTRGLVRVGVFEFWRPETMAGAKAVHLSEESLNLPLPRHLRKLIDCRDHHGRRQSVDLFIDNQQREPFLRRLPPT